MIFFSAGFDHHHMLYSVMTSPYLCQKESLDEFPQIEYTIYERT